MKNRWYVYVYCDPSKKGKWKYKNIEFNFEPFYVGKGTNKRSKIHLCPSNLNKTCLKSSKIKSLICRGLIPDVKIVSENLSNDQSIGLEIDMIKFFGRKDINTGILCNMTDGGDGISKMSKQIKTKISMANSKEIFQYDLNGNFIKKWNSISDVRNSLKIGTSNIPTSIKRGGTAGGFIWSYDFLGNSVLERAKYQMPNKYENIKQYDLDDNFVKSFDNALQIEKELQLRSGARNKIYCCLRGETKTAYGYKWRL